MGLLDLMRLMTVKRQRDQQLRCRQAQAQARDGSISSRLERKGSPCQLDDDSQGADQEMHSGPSLPEDIWHHIHSLVPMRDAARAACVSRSFLHSWRCHPNLSFSQKTLGLNKNACQEDKSARLFYIKVDHILRKHLGGVKKLKIQIDSDYTAKDSCYLNNWLQTAVTPGIEELTLILIPHDAKYNFPCLILSNGSGDSIQHLHLSNCSFRPTVSFGGLRSLTRLHLCYVGIKEDELGFLLSQSLALERLELRHCNKIVRLNVPHLLQRLSYLEVIDCIKLKLIDNKAPNISSFEFDGEYTVHISLGETSQIKSLSMNRTGSVLYARAELPSSLPNLEALSIYSDREMAHAPMLRSKFIHLRHLSMVLLGALLHPVYDYLSLASFLDAAPSLETFNLHLWLRCAENASVFVDPADLRQMRELQHHNLRSLRIRGFSSVKSLVELTCNILESVTSLECLTLESTQSALRCSDRGNKSGKCLPLDNDILREGYRGVLAIRRYIEPRVPSTVKLQVLEPCSCHAAVL